MALLRCCCISFRLLHPLWDFGPMDGKMLWGLVGLGPESNEVRNKGGKDWIHLNTCQLTWSIACLYDFTILYHSWNGLWLYKYILYKDGGPLRPGKTFDSPWFLPSLTPGAKGWEKSQVGVAQMLQKLGRNNPEASCSLMSLYSMEEHATTARTHEKIDTYNSIAVGFHGISTQWV